VTMNHARPAPIVTVGADPTTTAVAERVTVPGYYALDVQPDGLRLTEVSEELPTRQGADSSMRIYSTSSDKPELDPYLTLSTVGDTVGMPAIPESASSVQVGGLTTKQWTTNSRTNIALQKDRRWFMLVGSGIPNLGEVAVSASLDAQNASAQIDQSLLPPAISEQSIGDIHEVGFYSRLITTAATRAHWESPGFGSGVWFESFPESAETFRLHRIEYAYAKVEDIAVKDHSAVMLTGDQPSGDGQFFSILWNDGGRTTGVHSYGTSQAEPRTMAERLRPATAEEWASMKMEAQANRSHMTAEPGPVPTTALPPAFSMEGALGAHVEPRDASVGSTVMVTPETPVQRLCTGGVAVYREVRPQRFELLGIAGASTWLPPGTPMPACIRGPSSDPDQMRVPPLERGIYVLCLGFVTNALDGKGCGELTIV
jgi:hypothetical protein